MTGEDRQLAESLQAAKAAHFDADGAACDYAGLAVSRERGRLAACLADLEKFDPKRVRIPAQTAFWVNVFNAGVLRDIPELELAASPDEVQAFFERPRLRIGGRLYSLDDVQHGLLRGNLPKNGRLRAPMLRDDPRLAYIPIAYDERIHFAMHSACRSSPPLRVFDGGQLDVQFEDASTRSEEHTSELQSPDHLVCRLLLEKKNHVGPGVRPLDRLAHPGRRHHHPDA